MDESNRSVLGEGLVQQLLVPRIRPKHLKTANENRRRIQDVVTAVDEFWVE